MKVKRRPLTTVQLALTASYTTLYTVATGNDALISLTVCNDAATNVTFSIWKVPSAGSPGDGNLLVNQRQLADKESYVVRELAGLVLGEGETLQGNASIATQVTATGGVVLISRSQG